MSTLTEQGTRVAPLVRSPSPVFVDGSDARRVRAVRALIGLATVCLGCLVVLAVGLLGGPTPGGLLPWPGGTRTTEQPAAVRRPAPPARPGPGGAPVPRPRRPGPAAVPVPSPVPAQPRPAPDPTSAPPTPDASAATPTTLPVTQATAVPSATRGRSAEAPGHLKHAGRPSPRSKRPAIPAPTPAP